MKLCVMDFQKQPVVSRGFFVPAYETFCESPCYSPSGTWLETLKRSLLPRPAGPVLGDGEVRLLMPKHADGDLATGGSVVSTSKRWVVK